MMKSLVLYWSASGNTKKVAETIAAALTEKNVAVDVMKINETLDVDLYEYDMVFLGAPSYQWVPPEPVLAYFKNTLGRYYGGKRSVQIPENPGKKAVVFCTYSGPHTGVREAIPAGKYMGQFFEHLGFSVLDEWYTVGKFAGWEEGSTCGKMGDISQRPNQQDLDIIFQSTLKLVESGLAAK